MSTRRPLPQVVVVAGGPGTRLGARTAAVPKILVPVAGRPFLDYVLALLREQGVTALHFCLGHLAEQVVTHLRARPADGLDCTWSVEPRPLGTAGALRHALPWLEEEFVLLLGDTYTPVDLAAVVTNYRRSGCTAAMTVLRNRDWLVPSNVRVDAGAVVKYAKDAAPGTFEHVDYGIALLRRARLHDLPTDVPADLRVLFDRHIADHDLAAVEVPVRFYEIGSPTGLAEFERLVAEGRTALAESPS